MDKDDHVPEPFQKADIEEVFALYRQEIEEKKIKDKAKFKQLNALGFVEGETGGDALF